MVVQEPSKSSQIYDINTLAQFPFIHEASEYVRELGLSMDVILDSMAYRSAWARGKQRLEEALDSGKIHDHGTTTDAENITELLSYVIARIIVSCIPDPFLVRRYALAEAVSAYKKLQDSELKFVTAIAEQFDLKTEIKSDTLTYGDLELCLTDYLKYSVKIRAPEWKLVNRDLNTGSVRLTKRELARLVQEALRFRIQNELPVDVDDDLKKRIMPKIKELKTLVQTKKQKYETKDLGKVSIIRFPPCMKQLLGMTQAGENVPHVGRFAIATFLHHIGLSSDQILAIFGTSPDFDVEKARYQIEHITGKISGTEYTPPSCDTMKSNGICFNPDNLCKYIWLSHPLTYYRVKGKKKNIDDIKSSEKKS